MEASEYETFDPFVPDDDCVDENVTLGAPSGKKVLLRMIINNQVSCESFEVDAADVLCIAGLQDAFDQKLPMFNLAKPPDPGSAPDRGPRKFQDRQLYPGLLLFEETSASKRHESIHKRWTSTLWNESKNYSRWVQRCLREVNKDVLRIEMHMHIDVELPDGDMDQIEILDAFEQDSRATATGRAKLADTPLIQLANSDFNKPMKEWLPALTTSTNSPEDLAYALTTNQYLPERYIEDPLAFSQNCSQCYRIGRERGLIKASHRENARARDAAAQAANALDVTGENVTPTSKANAPEAPSPPINPTIGPANDMEADARLARALQAEENGLRRRRR